MCGVGGATGSDAGVWPVRGNGGDESTRRAVRRYVKTLAHEGWPDDEARLRDLMVLVEWTMRGDDEPSRTGSWQRLRRAIQAGLDDA